MTSANGHRPRMDAGLIRLGIVVLLGIIVSVIDGTVMVVAIDAVGRDFAASAPAVEHLGDRGELLVADLRLEQIDHESIVLHGA